MSTRIIKSISSDVIRFFTIPDIFFLSDRIRFKPAALLKMVSAAPLSVDLNASLILYENYQAGLLTRNFNSYGIFLQTLLKDKFRVGYVFEMPTGFVCWY